MFKDAKKKKNGTAAGEAKTPAAASAPAGSNPHPMFFRTPTPIDRERHAKAGITPTQDFSFARETNSIPLNALEFIEAAKYYPVVFTSGEQPMPVAIVGLEQENYFIDTDGSWKQQAYIPAYVRKYPFAFMDIPERKEFLLCVDESAAHFKSKGGQGAIAMYEGDKPAELLRNALEFCTAFHNHYQITRQFCADLKENNLLMQNQSNATLYNGRNIRLGGFQMIDEPKFNALSEEKFLEFRKRGWLPFIYFSIMSAANWRRLVDLAGTAEIA